MHQDMGVSVEVSQSTHQARRRICRHWSTAIPKKVFGNKFLLYAF